MGQIDQLKKNNKDLKKALGKINGKYSKATQELTAAKLEIEHLTRVRDILENSETLRSQRAWMNTTVSILIGVAVGVLVMWGIGCVQ
jgi:hypothetical protein